MDHAEFCGGEVVKKTYAFTGAIDYSQYYAINDNRYCSS
jgi:hypothetical protein